MNNKALVFDTIAKAVLENTYEVGQAAKAADGLRESLEAGAGRAWGKSLMSRPSLTLHERRWKWRR